MFISFESAYPSACHCHR